MCKHPSCFWAPIFYTTNIWGHTTSEVWIRKTPGEEKTVSHQLIFCTNCNTVIAMPTEIVEEEFNKIKPLRKSE